MLLAGLEDVRLGVMPGSSWGGGVGWPHSQGGGRVQPLAWLGNDLCALVCWASAWCAGALALFQHIGCVLQGHAFGVGPWICHKMPPLAIRLCENDSFLTLDVAALIAHLFFCIFSVISQKVRLAIF